MIFDNEHFIAVDKRPGYLSVPSRIGEADSRPCEGIEWQEKLKTRLFPVHRLDEEVSGILLFAKSEKAHQDASHWFEHRQVKKTYEALSEAIGAPYSPNQKLTWKSRLLRGKKRAYEKEFGKPSVTEVEFLGEGFIPQTWAWSLHPLTGRPHQLRFEMFKHKHPVFGDLLYGAKTEFRPSTIALRAVHLDLSQAVARERYGLPPELRVDSLHAWFQRNAT